jgi:hypothetical protein
MLPSVINSIQFHEISNGFTFINFFLLFIFLFLPFFFFQIVSYADRLQNKAILLIHFSARYTVEVWHYCFWLLKMINHPSQNLDLGENLTTLVNFSKLDLKHKLRIWTVWFPSNGSNLMTVVTTSYFHSSESESKLLSIFQTNRKLAMCCCF